MKSSGVIVNITDCLTMKSKARAGDTLEDLSREKLVGLLKGTYEFKQLAEYFEDHDLVYLDQLQEGRGRHTQKGHPD